MVKKWAEYVSNPQKAMEIFEKELEEADALEPYGKEDFDDDI